MSENPMIRGIFPATMTMFTAAGALDEAGTARHVDYLIRSGAHGIVSLHIARGKDPWVDWRPVWDRAHHMIAALVRGFTLPAGGAGEPISNAPAEPAP